MYKFKLIDFNVYNKNITKSKYYNIDGNNTDSKNFIIQMFGIDKNGKTASIIVDDFKPFFYIKVDDTWQHSTKTCFINELREKISPFYENSTIDNTFVEQKTLYGFDADKLHKFIKLQFNNTEVLNQVKNLWYNIKKSKTEYIKTLKPEGYIFENTNTYLYEANFPPLLRLFHIKEISPSGWIRLLEKHCKIVKNKKTYCDYEYEVSFENIEKLDINDSVPYKQCSFDIEASSSHGDFPLAIKDYKKLATDIINLLYRLNIQDKNILNKFLLQTILTAFNLTDKYYPDINRVYIKDKSINIDKEYIITRIKILINKIPDTKSIITDYDLNFNNYNLNENSDSDNDNDNIVEINNNEVDYIPKKKITNRYNKKKKILDILLDNECEYKDKINILNYLIYNDKDKLFPELEGDKVTFIGSTFKKYGEDDFYLKHCIVLNGCELPKINNDNKTNIIIETYNTEREVLLAWTSLIQREDPDIVMGYNINTFEITHCFSTVFI